VVIDELRGREGAGRDLLPALISPQCPLGKVRGYFRI
jgi:hypothetical protein